MKTAKQIEKEFIRKYGKSKYFSEKSWNIIPWIPQKLTLKELNYGKKLARKLKRKLNGNFS